MNKGISVIIPAYNVEQYIDKCLRSIQRQTYKTFEVIVVDDGSIDNTLEIAKSWEKKDNRFRCISILNGGVSNARNIGIKQATMEYMVFVDADDYLPIDAFEKRVRAIDSATLLITGYTKVNEIYDVISVVDGIDGCISIVNIINDSFEGIKYGYQGYLWNKLFLTSVIKRTGLQFETNIAYNEDHLFVVKYLTNIVTSSMNINHCVKCIEESTYFYYQRSESKMGVISIGYNSEMKSELNALEIMRENILQLSSSNSVYIDGLRSCEYIIMQHGITLLESMKKAKINDMEVHDIVETYWKKYLKYKGHSVTVLKKIKIWRRLIKLRFSR